MFRNVPFREISRSPLLTGVPGWQYTVCNSTKSKHITKFLKCALILTENFQEVISTEAPYQKFTDLQTAALRVFKVPEVTSMVDSFLQKQALTGSLQKNCSKQKLKPSSKACKCYEKDFLVDVLLHNKPRKTKIKTSKSKIKFLQYRCRRPCQCLMPVFPNGPAKLH